MRRKQKRLELARLEENTARAQRDVLEIKSRERQFARRDLALLKVQDQAQETDGLSTTTPQL